MTNLIYLKYSKDLNKIEKVGRIFLSWRADEFQTGFLKRLNVPMSGNEMHFGRAKSI